MPDFIFSVATLEVIAQIKIHKLTMSSLWITIKCRWLDQRQEDEDRFLMNPINGGSAHNKVTNN